MIELVQMILNQRRKIIAIDPSMKFLEFYIQTKDISSIVLPQKEKIDNKATTKLETKIEVC